MSAAWLHKVCATYDVLLQRVDHYRSLPDEERRHPSRMVAQRSLAQNLYAFWDRLHGIELTEQKRNPPRAS